MKAKTRMNSPHVRRLILWVAGVCLIGLAFQPVFRNPEGLLKGAFCLPLAVGLAFFILGWTVSGRLGKTGGWLALGLVGQGVALQLIDAVRCSITSTTGRLVRC